MKIKNIVSIAATVVVGMLGTFKAEAQSQVLGGYPIFYGSFQQAGPLASTLGSASMATNTAALTRTANPITSGVNWTNGLAQGFLTVSILATNAENASLINVTTGQTNSMGNVAAAGTNYSQSVLILAPGDIVLYTNGTTGPNLLNSEFRN
jgi:hypothetical protein